MTVALEVFHLPLALWFIGVGNLGQSYLWTLAMLPYPNAQDVRVFLQDDDVVGEENWGTSILVDRGRYGILKTQVAEEWAQRRGFCARRIDRRLDQHLRRTDREPLLALAGLDRMPPRRLLGLPGFEYVSDAGLGATAADYHKFRINVFDNQQDPAKHFEDVEDADTQRVVDQLLQLPAYQELVQREGQCGAAMLAERSVAVPFVSAFVSALVVTQAIRIASGQHYFRSLTGTLTDLRSFRGTASPTPSRTNVANVIRSRQDTHASRS